MEAQAKLWYLEEFDLFQSMNREEIRSVEKTALMRPLPKDAVLRFPQMLNSYVYLLKEGVIKICVQQDGKEFIKYLIKPGNLFGEIPLLGDYESNDEYAVALLDSLVCFLDAAKMKHWMETNVDLRVKVYKQISQRIRKVENRLMSMIFKDVRRRILEFIIDFAMEFGEYQGQAYVVKNFLTHDDIAKLTATSRQTVTSVLNEFREQRLIDYNSRLIKVYFTSSPPLKPNIV